MNKDLMLNIPVMDTMHDEFETLLLALQNSSQSEFMTLFQEMIEHTVEHFKTEENIMNAHNFYDKKEHFDEHANLLGEMKYFYEKAKKHPMFGKSYINDYAYEKFRRHIVNIDSQLAMFLKEKNLEK
ncbi:MAG: hemerythrin family protein [Pseudomonadota bacterium]